MAFPRKPSLLMKYKDEEGTIFQYTSYGWVVLKKSATQTNSIKKKDRIKYSGSSKITVTSKPPLE